MTTQALQNILNLVLKKLAKNGKNGGGLLRNYSLLNETGNKEMKLYKANYKELFEKLTKIEKILIDGNRIDIITIHSEVPLNLKNYIITSIIMSISKFYAYNNHNSNGIISYYDILTDDNNLEPLIKFLVIDLNGLESLKHDKQNDFLLKSIKLANSRNESGLITLFIGNNKINELIKDNQIFINFFKNTILLK